MSETALASNLVHFVRYLRARGLSLVPETARDLVRTIEVVGLENRDDVYHAFCAVTVVRPSDREAFDDAFDLFFGSGVVPTRMPGDDPATAGAGRARAHIPVVTIGDDDESFADADLEEIVGASARERLGDRDFGGLTPEEKEEVRRLISQMVWKPAAAVSRRWAPARSGSRPHLRRTFRGLLTPEGDLMPLSYAERRPRRRPMIVLADVSGSMERYSELFLHFMHAAQGRLGRIEAFVFSTRLTRITRELRQRRVETALARVGRSVPDWSGGTRIGEALQAFNRDWSRRVTRGGAIGLIISDGWDTGEPALLRAEMGKFARALHRVVWLNPLAGRAGFEPATVGMRAALPHVDDLLAAGTLHQLRDVVRLLESVPVRKRGPS